MLYLKQNIWIIFAVMVLSLCSCGNDSSVDGDVDQTQTDGDVDNATDGDFDTDQNDGDMDIDLSEGSGEEEEEMGCLVPDGDDEPSEIDNCEDVDAEEAEADTEAMETDGEPEDEQEIAEQQELDDELEVEVETSLCPDDMVIALREGGAKFCIDRYEASRADADGNSGGSDESVAKSVKGVIPWYVNQMSETHFNKFKEACGAAGKRICQATEWKDACKGPDNYVYTYGGTFNKETCNCVATFCDDYCTDNSIPMESCNLDVSSCGYSCGQAGGSTVQCMKIVQTGAFENCTNSYGHFDINGNVWEIVESTIDTRGYETRGGAYNCAYPGDRVSCTYNAGWESLYAGFRCCKDITE